MMKRIYSPETIYKGKDYISGGKPVKHSILNNLVQTGFVEEDQEYDFLYKRHRKEQKSTERQQWNLKNKHLNTQYELAAYKEQVEACRFLDYVSPREELKPFLFFYKFLSRKVELLKKDLTKFSKLELWIPDTIVYGDRTDFPFWIYTNHEGVVCRTENFSERHIVSKLGNQYSIDELVAICKTPHFEDKHLYGNICQLMSTRDLASKMAMSTGAGQSETMVIQKFVKSKGPNAFVTRAVWRKNKPPSCFVITNKTSFFESNKHIPEEEKYITDVKRNLSCSIVHSKGGKVSEESCAQVEKIVKFFERYSGYFLEEMVCDFIKQFLILNRFRDESGLWWFIGCKSFKVYGDNGHPSLKNFIHESIDSDSDESPEKEKKKKLVKVGSKQEYTKLRMCRFCQIGYPVSELTHSLTLLMILKTEKRIKDQKLDVKLDINHNPIDQHFEWLNHGDISQYDQVSLYQPHKVCKTCFTIFKEVEQLRIVEKKFAQALGIPTEMHEEVEEQDPIELLQKKNEDDQDTIMITQLYRFRILLSFHHITDFDFVLPPSYKNHNLTLEYNILNFTKQYRLRPQPMNENDSIDEQRYTIPLNRIRMYYFFTQDMNSFYQFVREEKLKIRLLCDGKELASAQYSLHEFQSPYVMKIGLNSMLCGQNKSSCYLKFYIGLCGNEEKVDVREVKIKIYKEGIYLPQENYYACEVLPPDWTDIIPSQNVRKSISEQNIGFYSPSPEFKSPFLHVDTPLQEPIYLKYSQKKSPGIERTSNSKIQRKQQPSQKKSKRNQSKLASQTLKNSSTQQQLPTYQRFQQNSDIRIKNIRLNTNQQQQNSGMKKNFTQGNLTLTMRPNNQRDIQELQNLKVISKKRPETSGNRFRQSNEEKLLTEKLKMKLQKINRINDNLFVEQQFNFSKDNETVMTLQTPTSTIFTFVFKILQLFYEPKIIGESQGSMAWICQIEVFNQKFVSDQYIIENSMQQIQNQTHSQNVFLNFTQNIYIQESRDNLQSILQSNLITFKIMSTNGQNYLATFNLSQLCQDRHINTQLILQNERNQNEFVRLFVDIEIEEEDLSVLRGKKTLRQTVLTSPLLSVDDRTTQRTAPKNFEVIIPF